MNPLSWMIILISIFEKIDAFTTGGIVLSIMLIVFIFILIGGSMMGESCNSVYDKQSDWHSNFRAKMRGYIKWPVIALFIFSLLNVFAIERNYMVMIAASEIGQMALESDGGKQISGLSADAVDLLKVYIESEKDNIKAELAKKAKTVIDNNSK